MNDWTSGYVADIGYNYGYYTELNPLRANLALLNHGFAPPPEGPCCELGFGQGLSANIQAAASGAAWWGTDFMPDQVEFAQGLARASGADVHLFDQSFAEFCTRTDLPDFAFIGLHGVWSWVSDESRTLIADFIRRKLIIGGVVYMGYNTLPGWANFVPMRNLLTQFGSSMVPSGLGTAERVRQSLDFADKLLALNPLNVKANPQVRERLLGMRKHAASYLAHEYFNSDWHPMSFEDVAGWLAPAKIRFAASATLSEHVNAATLTEDQRVFLGNMQDVVLRESVRDFLFNQQFRRDYWVKGGARLDQAHQFNLVRQQKVMLATAPRFTSNKFDSVLGGVTVDSVQMGQVLEALGDYLPLTLGELESRLARHGMPFAQMFQILMLMLGRGYVVLVHDKAAAKRAKPHADKLNAAIIASSPFSERDIAFLASPVTGGGHHVTRTHQMFLMAVAKGNTSVESILGFIRGAMASANVQTQSPEGRPETLEESVARLRDDAVTFLADMLPVYRALGIA